MERAVRESEEKHRAVFENTGEAINIVTGDRVVSANEQSFALLQCSREDLYGRPFLDFIHPDDRDEAKRLYLERLSGHTIDPVWTFRAIGMDGRSRWLETRSTHILGEAMLPVSDRDGNIVAAIESIRNISGGKHAENMQLQSKQLFENVVNLLE